MGPYLSAPITTKESAQGSNAKLRYGATHMQGWRNTMEDAHLTALDIDESTSVFGVFDGHGGKEVALYVAQHFTAELKKNPRYASGDIENALKQTFLRMDEMLRTPEGCKEVLRLQRDLPPDSPVDAAAARDIAANVGCTSVVAVLQGTRLYVSNAGDSRCVLGHGGQAVPMSIDHKPELPEELARIRGAGSVVIEGRVNGNINLSRSLGDLDYKNAEGLSAERQAVTAMPEIKTVELTGEDDFIVLCCDGIWDILSSQQCVDFIYQRIGTVPLHQIAEGLCDQCLAKSTTEKEGKGCDNMTAVIVAFNR